MFVLALIALITCGPCSLCVHCWQDWVRWGSVCVHVLFLTVVFLVCYIVIIIGRGWYNEWYKVWYND